MKSGTLAGQYSEGVISTEVREISELIFDYVLGSIIGYLSICDNIIALFAFKKMGYHETMNISLSAIAFWDIVKSLSQVVMKLQAPIKLISEPFAITWKAHTVFTLGYVYTIAGYVSGVMAAYVSLERCLCVSLPLTVKFLLTRKVVTMVNILISFFVVSSYVVVYTAYRIYWVYSPTYNQTIARYSHSPHHHKYPQIDQYTKILSVIYPFACFTTICVCSVVTVYFLKKSSKFRSSTSTTGVSSHKQAEQHSSRNRQITKILLVIIGVYIVTYIPRICYYITFSLVSEFRPFGRYRNAVWFNIYLMSAFDLLNSAANPFILYFMSSQFRSTLISMICRSREEK